MYKKYFAVFLSMLIVSVTIPLVNANSNKQDIAYTKISYAEKQLDDAAIADMALNGVLINNEHTSTSINYDDYPEINCTKLVSEEIYNDFRVKNYESMKCVYLTEENIDNNTVKLGGGYTYGEATDSSYTVKIIGKIYFSEIIDNGLRYRRLTKTDCTPTLLDSTFRLTKLHTQQRQHSTYGYYTPDDEVDNKDNHYDYYPLSGGAYTHYSWFWNYAYVSSWAYYLNAKFALTFERVLGSTPCTFEFVLDA